MPTGSHNRTHVTDWPGDTVQHSPDHVRVEAAPNLGGDTGPDHHLLPPPTHELPAESPPRDCSGRLPYHSHR